jgi:hypothetical protein
MSLADPALNGKMRREEEAGHLKTRNYSIQTWTYKAMAADCTISSLFVFVILFLLALEFAKKHAKQGITTIHEFKNGGRLAGRIKVVLEIVIEVVQLVHAVQLFGREF